MIKNQLLKKLALIVICFILIFNGLFIIQYLRAFANKEEQKKELEYKTVYALSFTPEYYIASPLSNAKWFYLPGDEITIYEQAIGLTDNNYCKTADGYVRSDMVTDNLDNVFYPIDEIWYAAADTVLRSGQDPASSIVREIPFNEIIYVNGVNNKNIYSLTENGITYYIDGADLMKDKYVSPQPTYTYPSGGGKLTRSGGVYFDEWGHRETYYNLNMSYCIAMMRDLGYDENNYPYWIRDDGCKMLGPYVMIAANFDWYPKGTLLEFSLGTGIVVDTGDFIYEWPDGIDVCVNW